MDAATVVSSRSHDACSFLEDAKPLSPIGPCSCPTSLETAASPLLHPLGLHDLIHAACSIPISTIRVRDHPNESFLVQRWRSEDDLLVEQWPKWPPWGTLSVFAKCRTTEAKRQKK